MLHYYFSILVKCKIEILTGIFAALAIYSYFYKIKLEKQISLIALKKRIKKIAPAKLPKIMSDERFKHLEDVLNRIEAYVKERLDKMDNRLDTHQRDNEDLEKRIVLIEKNNAITRREIAIYVTIGVFVLLQVLDKINVI
jgi:hypothetical protein